MDMIARFLRRIELILATLATSSKTMNWNMA